jgi:hypothetical protein
MAKLLDSKGRKFKHKFKSLQNRGKCHVCRALTNQPKTQREKNCGKIEKFTFLSFLKTIITKNQCKINRFWTKTFGNFGQKIFTTKLEHRQNQNEKKPVFAGQSFYFPRAKCKIVWTRNFEIDNEIQIRKR